MTLTPDQVADLMPGDEVEIRDARFPEVITHGPLHADLGRLILGDRVVRYANGQPSTATRCMTVVSRVPRTPYVNNSRDRHWNGDVVRNADDTTDARVWLYALESADDQHPWCRGVGGRDSQVWWRREDLPERLVLLVDGVTGRVVSS